MRISSQDFSDYGPLDSRFTHEGENISPVFEISDVPNEAESLILIVHDPDSTHEEPFTHWLVWNIPTDTTRLSSSELPKKAIQGTNDFRETGYGGPQPKAGSGVHRYVFSLYAVRGTHEFDQSKTTRLEILREIADSIAAQSQWVGTYEV